MWTSSLSRTPDDLIAAFLYLRGAYRKGGKRLQEYIVIGKEDMASN